MGLFKRREDKGFGSHFSLEKFLTAPFRALVSRLSGKDSALGSDATLLSRIFRGIGLVLFFPIWLVIQLATFVIVSWTTTRNGTAFFWGLVPLLVIGAFAGVLLAAGFLEDRTTKRIHREKVIEAEKSEDFDTAVLCSRRVQNINQEGQWKFIHAATLKAAGMDENALALIHQLASPTEIGLIPAHLYLADWYLREEAAHLDEGERLDLARQHLDQVIEKEPDTDRGMAARVTRAKVWLAQDKTEDAMEFFESNRYAIRMDPTIVPTLAEYLISQNKINEARNQIEAGINALRMRAEIDPNRPEIWDTMYKILMVTDDFSQANEELNRAIRQTNDPNVRGRIRQLQSNVLVSFAETVQNLESQDGYRRQLIPVCQAIQVYPRNARALSMFIDLILYPANPEFEEWLEGEARDNVSPQIYHVIHGVRDAVQGKPPSSQEHFKLSFDGDPRTAIIINDIAWLLSTMKEQHEDAERLVNVAIDTWSGSAKLYQTRGEILMAMGRHEEAVTELEYAVSKIENDPRAHMVLAECYEQMERPEEAEQQRELAREVESRILLLREEALRKKAENAAK
ncbi:MAG: tetratricopeptide repeat protein [Pirellulaceae bacterium]